MPAVSLGILAPRLVMPTTSVDERFAGAASGRIAPSVPVPASLMPSACSANDSRRHAPVCRLRWRGAAPDGLISQGAQPSLCVVTWNVRGHSLLSLEDTYACIVHAPDDRRDGGDPGARRSSRRRKTDKPAAAAKPAKPLGAAAAPSSISTPRRRRSSSRCPASAPRRPSGSSNTARRTATSRRSRT